MELNFEKLRRIEEVDIALRAVEEHWMKEVEAARSEYNRQHSVLNRELTKRTGRTFEDHLMEIRAGMDYSDTNHEWIPGAVEQVVKLKTEWDRLAAIQHEASKKREGHGGCMPRLQAFAKRFTTSPAQQKINPVTTGYVGPDGRFTSGGDAGNGFMGPVGSAMRPLAHRE